MGDPLLRPSHRSELRRGLVTATATTVASNDNGYCHCEDPLKRELEQGLPGARTTANDAG